MRKRVLSAILLAVAALAAACAAVFFAACTGGDEYRWDVSGADGKITAYFSDNGKYGFILNVEGNGRMNDYSSVKDTPWYGKSGRVTEVVNYRDREKRVYRLQGQDGSGSPNGGFNRRKRVP